MRIFAALAGLLLLLFLVAVSLPARLLPMFLPADALRLSGLSGTLLDGHAARAMLRTPAGFLHLGSLSWKLYPSSLLGFAPRLDVRSEWGGQRAALVVQLRGDAVVLRDVDASVDARLLRTLAPLAVDGRLGLQFDRLVLRDFQPREASGRLVWQDAVWQASGRRYTLGTYVAQVENGAGDAIRASVDTLSGPVFTRGFASLSGSAYELEFRIDGDGRPLAPEVDRALRLFATPEEDGYLLRLDGDLGVVP